jgi:hypothetical protein
MISKTTKIRIDDLRRNVGYDWVPPDLIESSSNRQNGCPAEHYPDVFLGLDVGQDRAGGDSPANGLVQVSDRDV